MENLDITYYKPIIECMPREATSIEEGLSRVGMFLDCNSIDLDTTENIGCIGNLEIYGGTIKEIVYEKINNTLNFVAKDCSFNGYMQEHVHLCIGDYIFRFEIISLIYNRPNCIKCGTYMLDKIYDAKDSGLLKVALIAYSSIECLTEDTLNRILEECALVEL